jgi:hypothetical protein
VELETYVVRQASIVRRIVRSILGIFLPFRGVPVEDETWDLILRTIYPSVEDARRESAELAREFYDTLRELEYPDEQYDIDLAPYEYEWFEEAMRPSRQKFRLIDTSLGEVTQAALRVAKEVENGGRRTMLYAIQKDGKRPRWARVATGAETCGFCLMLVSRGPVYITPDRAGAEAGPDALDLLDEEGNAALTELMTRWHPGCDCKIVPVFDTKKDWPGKQDYLEAYELWKEVTKGYSGRDALNAFRRAIESGKIDPADMSVA